MEKKISEKLARWQQRLQQSDNEWKSEVADMDLREKRYNGDRTLSPLVEGDTRRNGQPKKTSHVRNIIFENIESQVSSAEGDAAAEEGRAACQHHRALPAQ